MTDCAYIAATFMMTFMHPLAPGKQYARMVLTPIARTRLPNHWVQATTTQCLLLDFIQQRELVYGV